MSGATSGLLEGKRSAVCSVSCQTLMGQRWSHQD